MKTDSTQAMTAPECYETEMPILVTIIPGYGFSPDTYVWQQEWYRYVDGEFEECPDTFYMTY